MIKKLIIFFIFFTFVNLSIITSIHSDMVNRESNVSSWSPYWRINFCNGHQLYEGFNLIGWYQEYNTTASSLYENISGCLSIIKWDPVVQDYWLYLPGFPAFDFVITQGMGLFIEVNQSSIWC